MREFYGTFFVGAMLGVAGAVYFMNNQQNLQSAGRQVKAKSKKAVNFIHNISNEMEHNHSRKNDPSCC